MTPTEYLLAHGWRRSDLPAEVVDECGASGDRTGWCVHPARWERSSYPLLGPLCAQHAVVAEKSLAR